MRGPYRAQHTGQTVPAVALFERRARRNRILRVAAQVAPAITLYAALRASLAWFEVAFCVGGALALSAVALHRITPHLKCPRCANFFEIAGGGLRISRIVNTCFGASRTPVSAHRERSEATLGVAGQVVASGTLLSFRLDGPLRSILYALWTKRSKIASATPGSPIQACHLSRVS